TGPRPDGEHDPEGLLEPAATGRGARILRSGKIRAVVGPARYLRQELLVRRRRRRWRILDARGGRARAPGVAAHRLCGSAPVRRRRRRLAAVGGGRVFSPPG